ncbi:hypothetical protein EDD21DRAFT_165539 [Dissophora ornata]|nr:hypothetical protein EDD21DRAFT_165539 [Dissophora ornata]
MSISRSRSLVETAADNSISPQLSRKLLLFLAIASCALALPTSVTPVSDGGGVDLNVGQHVEVSSQDWALGIVLIIFGLVEVFFGFKFIRLTLVVTGFLSWAMSIMVAIRWDLVFTTFMPKYYYMWVWLAAGLTGAILSFRFWDLGVTFTGAFGGFALAMAIVAIANLSISNAGRYVVMVILILGGAAFATFFERCFIIVGTSLGGAYMFMFGVDEFVQVGYREMIVIFDFTGKTLTYHPNLQVYLMLGFWLVLAGLGIAWEYWHHETPLLIDRHALFRIYGRPFGKRPRKLVGERIHQHLEAKWDLYEYIFRCGCLQKRSVDDALCDGSCDTSDIRHPVPGQGPVSGEQPSPTAAVQGDSGSMEPKITPPESNSNDSAPLKSAPVDDDPEKITSSSGQRSLNDETTAQHSESSESVTHTEHQGSRTTHVTTTTTSHIEHTDHTEHSGSTHTESHSAGPVAGIGSPSTIHPARPSQEPHHPLFSQNLGTRTLEMLRLVTEDISPGSTIPREFRPENSHTVASSASTSISSVGSSTSLFNHQGLHMLEISESTQGSHESHENEGSEGGHETAMPHGS